MDRRTQTAITPTRAFAPRTRWVVGLAAILAVASAAPTQGTVLTPPDRNAQALNDAANVARELDVLVQQLAVAQMKVRLALRKAESATATARSAELESMVSTSTELKAQLDDLASSLTARIKSMRDLRSRIATDVPPEMIDLLVPLRERVDGALKIRELPDAVRVLEEVEKQLTDNDDLKRLPGADALLSLTRYRLGDTLRQQASVEIVARFAFARAEKLLLRARERFDAVLDGPDVADSVEGTSLHAAALRRVVQAEVVLYEGYRDLRDQVPSNRSHAGNASKHRQAAVEAYEQLQRIHPDATLPDNRTFVQAADEDIDRARR